jgi:hypothetical protein
VVRNEGGTVTSLDWARKRRAAESIVVCLDCGAAYAKPAGAGTLRANPGCPACGYVGWIGVAGTGRGGHGAAAPARVANGNRRGPWRRRRGSRLCRVPHNAAWLKGSV